ncbi:hypothetical protein SERLA73DRAFT_190108 [Serpula lacrymans var. lacrymans S7.3]|uniref:Uncharacterized protein n=1 Tax=Serpula lacrymans var. lacrymans (strain S7.3) TaxID=936435 RepID=F8QF29_SERL3|nr:hypothetical protein SERLA73DRAFT_190108 [Serpula lacrymans var. lacrymans S7.3]
MFRTCQMLRNQFTSHITTVPKVPCRSKSNPISAMHSFGSFAVERRMNVSTNVRESPNPGPGVSYVMFVDVFSHRFEWCVFPLASVSNRSSQV